MGTFDYGVYAQDGSWRVTDGRHPGFKAGNWYLADQGVLAAGATFATGSIRLLPMVLPRPITISDLGCRLTTQAASGNCQLAIYKMSTSTFDPIGTALCSTSSISTTTAGILTSTLSAPVHLTTGYYYMAVNMDATAGGTAVFQTFTGGLGRTGWLIGSATQANISGSATVAALVKTIASAYNTWPDLTGGTFAEAAANSSCLLHMKAA